jgi:hypothetical protein
MKLLEENETEYKIKKKVETILSMLRLNVNFLLNVDKYTNEIENDKNIVIWLTKEMKFKIMKKM